MFGGTNQSTAAADTDTISLDNETLATSESAIPLPAGVGEIKTSIRWITPIYGQRVTQEKMKSSGGGK